MWITSMGNQSYKFKKIAKISNFEILQQTLHVTHLMKFLYKMYKYEMDPTRTVEATVRTRDAGRTRDGRGTDGWTDGRTDGVKPIYPPNNFVVRYIWHHTTSHYMNQCWLKFYNATWFCQVPMKNNHITENQWISLFFHPNNIKKKYKSIPRSTF